MALKSRILLKPFLASNSVLWKLTKKKKANLIKARFNIKKGPDIAFLQKNFQDQMASGVHLPKSPCGISSWGGWRGDPFISVQGTPRFCFFHTES